MSDVTTILAKLNSGDDPKASEELLSLVYNELRIIARSKMNQERAGHTLQPTILVNDAWLKLFPPGTSPQFNGRAHFFGASAKAMRRILIDHARGKLAEKRGHKLRAEVSDTEFVNFPHPAKPELTVAIDEALSRFANIDKVTVDLIELRFFVGMTVTEAANALKISKRSAERDCAYFAAWFRREYAEDLGI